MAASLFYFGNLYISINLIWPPVNSILAVVNSDLEVSLISIFLIWPPVNSNFVISIISIIPILLGSEIRLHFDNKLIWYYFDDL